MTDSDSKEFVAQVEKVRKKLGLSQAAFCRRLDIHQSVYQRWIKGSAPRRATRDWIFNRMKEVSA